MNDFLKNFNDFLAWRWPANFLSLLYLCMHIYIYIHICIYICVCIYIYMYTHAAEQLGGQVLLLQFDRYSEKLEGILLGSTPAHKAARLGCDFQPSWGNGAKNFVIGLEPVHLGGILPCDTLGVLHTSIPRIFLQQSRHQLGYSLKNSVGLCHPMHQQCLSMHVLCPRISSPKRILVGTYCHPG